VLDSNNHNDTFLVAFGAVWTCREINTFQRNTLSNSSVYFGSEHGYSIFLRVDGIDLQAHSVNTQNNNTVVITVVRTPSVIVYKYYFYRNTNFVQSLEVYDDDATVLKCSFCFNLINYIFFIKITFRKLVLFISSGESRGESYSFWPPEWATVKPGPGGTTKSYDLSKTLIMYL
jgi:hypothetical protein